MKIIRVVVIIDKNLEPSQEIEKADDFICIKVDGDKRQDLIMSYNINDYPTTVFLDPTGTELIRIPGYIGPGQFNDEMNNALEYR